MKLALETLTYSQTGATQNPGAVSARYMQMCLALWCTALLDILGMSPETAVTSGDCLKEQVWSHNKIDILTKTSLHCVAEVLIEVSMLTS